MSKLKPCPFCGEANASVSESPYGGWFAKCGWCGAEIGSPNSEEDAAENWNRRAESNNQLTLDDNRRIVCEREILREQLNESKEKEKEAMEIISEINKSLDCQETWVPFWLFVLIFALFTLLVLLINILN